MFSLEKLSDIFLCVWSVNINVSQLSHINKFAHVKDQIILQFFFTGGPKYLIKNQENNIGRMKWKNEEKGEEERERLRFLCSSVEKIRDFPLVLPFF